MNPTEKGHANPPKPAATPSAPAPAAGGSGTQWLFSTRLKVEKEAPQTPGSVSAWIKTNVLTPTRDTLRRVDVELVMDTIFGVRRQLAIDSPSELDLPLHQISYPNQSNPGQSRPERAPGLLSFNNPPNQPGGVSKFIVAPEMPAAGASQFSVSPGSNNNNNSTQSTQSTQDPTRVFSAEPSVLVPTSQPLQPDPSATSALLYSENQSTQSTQGGDTAETLTAGTIYGLKYYDVYQDAFADKQIENPTRAAFGGWWHPSSGAGNNSSSAIHAILSPAQCRPRATVLVAIYSMPVPSKNQGKKNIQQAISKLN